jgi:hypothetical protein
MMLSSIPLHRCYPKPVKDDDEPKQHFEPEFKADSEIAAVIARVGFPWAGPMLLFDCETLTDAHGGQRLRFGFFQERGMRYDRRVASAKAGSLTRDKLDMCWSNGIFYEPANCTDEEIEVMENYVMEHEECSLMTRDEFVRNILHRNHYVKYANDWKERLREPCLVIGHNLPFDLGALSIHCELAAKDLYGGLSLILSGGEHDELVMGETDQEYAARVEVFHKQTRSLVETDEAFEARVKAYREAGLPEPRRHGEAGVAKHKFEYRVAIKKTGFGKALYRDGSQKNGAYVGEDGKVRPRYMQLLHFVDTNTMGNALLGLAGPVCLSCWTG